MNLTRFVRKNASVILIGAIIGAIVGTYMAYKQTEGFQSSCNMSYCNDANFETVTTKSGQKLCLKKCNRIKANYITATSDQTICKDMSGNRVVKTVSRNTNIYSKLNINGNNSCQISTRAIEISAPRNTCINQFMGITAEKDKCYVCIFYNSTSNSGRKRPDKNSQGVYMC